MKRSLPALRLKKSPLVMALGQVRVASVLQMDKFIPPIQERLRHCGYPLFRAEVTKEVVFGPKPSLSEKTRWLFSSEDKTGTVVVANDFVVLETSKYQTFDEYTERLLEVLEIVGEEAQLSIVLRLGLRYVDLIRTDQPNGFSTYLRQGLLGLSEADLGVENLLYQYRMTSDTAVGKLVIRLFQKADGTFLPPDLNAAELAFGEAPPAGEIVSILDLDHFSETQRSFEPEKLISEMWELHDFCDRSFRAAVTPDALKLWEVQEI